MATIPEEKTKPTLAQRVPVRNRLAGVIVAVGAAASFADQPFAALAVAGVVIIAWDFGKRR